MPSSLPQTPEQHVSLVDIPAGHALSTEQLWRALEYPALLMHSAEYFGIQASPFENAFTRHHLQNTTHNTMHVNKTARLEQQALAAIYRYHGHHVTVMLPQPDALDGVYTTDSDMTFQAATPSNDKWKLGPVISILPTFTHTRRQQESEWKACLQRSTHNNPNPRAHRAVISLKHPMEFGDTRIIFHEVRAGRKDGGFVLAGLAENTDKAIGRSSPEGHHEFKSLLREHLGSGVDVYSIALRQPFYHMDTTGISAPNGEFFTHPCAFQPDGWEMITSLFGDKLVILPEEDLHSFCGNGTAFGNRIYVSDTLSIEGQHLMTERGYDVFMTPIHAISQGGGGHRCMTSVNPEMYIEGGYHFPELDFSRTGNTYSVCIDIKTDSITLHACVDNAIQSDGVNLRPFAMNFDMSA